MAGSRLLSLGTRGSITGLQNSISGATTASPHANQFWDTFAGETEDTQPVSTRPPGKSSDRSSPVHVITGILQPTVHSSEGVRPVETYHRPVDAKHVCGQYPNLPDGYTGPHKTVPNTRQLGSVPGSTGCISSASDSRISSQVPTVLVRQHNLPVSSTSVSACQLPHGSLPK